MKMILKNALRIILITLSCFYIWGCASSVPQPQGDALLPEIDMVQLKENSNEALKLAQEAKLNVETLSNKVTELNNRIIILSDEISGVSLAKIEDIEMRLSLLIEAYKDLHHQLTALETLPKIHKKGRKPSNSIATFSPSEASRFLSSSEYALYQQALNTFNNENYTRARDLFTEVIEKYPDGSYSANAQYWIGECYYAESKFAHALAAFNKVLKYKTSPKKDDAQMKIGITYLKMGKNPSAKEAFQKVIDRYPASEYAERAKKYLSQIKF